jgi:hypothetical protein
MIEAGSDTTSSWFQTLVLAMVAFPEVQNKAQVSSILLPAFTVDVKQCL